MIISSVVYIECGRTTGFNTHVSYNLNKTGERWNDKIVECDTLPGNYYNTIINALNGTYYGSKAEITCPTGYRLEGPYVLTCLATGQCSALPCCIKLEPSTLLPPPSSTPTAAAPLPPSTTVYRPKVVATQTTTNRPSYRPSITSTSSSSTYGSSTPQIEINGEDSDVTYVIPGTVCEEFPNTTQSSFIPKKPQHHLYLQCRPPQR